MFAAMNTKVLAALAFLLLVTIASIDARSAKKHKTHQRSNAKKENKNVQHQNAEQREDDDEPSEKPHQEAHKKHYNSPHPDQFPGDFWQYPYPYTHPVYNCLPVPECPCENSAHPQASNPLEEGAKEKSKKPKAKASRKQLVPSHYYGPPSAGWGGFCPGQTGSGWGSPYWYRSGIPMRPMMGSRRFEIMQRNSMPFVGWNAGWAGKMPEVPFHAPIGYAIRSFSGMPQGTAEGGIGKPYDHGISQDFGTGLSHGWGTQFPNTGRWWESEDRSGGLDNEQEKEQTGQTDQVGQPEQAEQMRQAEQAEPIGNMQNEIKALTENSEGTVIKPNDKPPQEELGPQKKNQILTKWKIKKCNTDA